MGCVGSKKRRARKYSAGAHDFTDIAEVDKVKETKIEAVPQQATEQDKATSASGNIVNMPQAKLNPKDFQFVNGKDEVKVKPPGSIKGQSFMVDKCENCDIYILDTCGQVTVDECKNCRLYVGPTDGSVFIRDCSGCNLAVVCRQLRTRDCTGCNISLYCRTKPIVESSSAMGFACLDLSYPELKDQMRNAKLSSFHNFWYDIFDFTPKEGNWRLLPVGTSAAALLEPIPPEVSALLRGKAEAEAAGAQPSPLLPTLGQHPPPPLADGLSYMFAAFDGAKHDRALQLARTAAEKGWLLRTNQARLSAAAAAALAAEAGWAKSEGKALSSGDTAGCVGLELLVPSGAAPEVRTQLAQLGGHVSASEAAGKSFRTAGLDG